jgi:zinc/manganese transport system substrate-binding protein/manganese/iron transport system substrate-binding protein
MDAANRRLVATVPAAERKLVTNHDAFAYLAAHYDIRVVGSVIPALSSAAQPSAQDVADLVDRIRAEHVRAIFTESSLDPTLERQIASEAGVRVYANLYGDTLGPPGSPGATYLGMERWNVRAMVAGFLGRLPVKHLYPVHLFHRSGPGPGSSVDRRALHAVRAAESARPKFRSIARVRL